MIKLGVGALFAALCLYAQPAITSLSPNSVAAGGDDVNLAINGTFDTNPTTTTAVFWTPSNGTPMQLLEFSMSTDGTQIIADVPYTWIAQAVNVTVLVKQTPYLSNAPLSSNSLPFQVLAPTVTSLNPAWKPISGSGPGFLLTVTGTNFTTNSLINPSGQTDSQIVFGSQTLTTTFVNSQTLTAQIPASDLVAAATYPVSVINPGGSATSNSLPFTVYSPLAITTTSLVPGTYGASYDYTLAAAGGVPPYTWSSGVLPAALSLNSSTGEITGTLSATQSTTLSATVRDAAGNSANAQFPLVVALVVTTTSLPNGLPGQSYTATLSAVGGVLPYTWSATGLPSGLSLSSTGQITGTVSSSTTATVNVTVRDTAGDAGTARFTLIIAPPTLTITTASLPAGMAGQPYTGTLAASGGVPSYTWSAAGLPTGLTINTATGQISGTPAGASSGTVTVTVRDSLGTTATARFTLTISAPSLAITTASLPGAVAGQAYDFIVTATGGVPPYTWSATGLPNGLVINSSTGEITGTPSASTFGTVTITVRDTASNSISARFNITVANPPLRISTPSLPQGTVGLQYSVGIAATGGVPGYSFSVTQGSLPPGLGLALSGLIGGNPTTTGTFQFTVEARDSIGTTADHAFSLVIAPPALAITTASLANVPLNSSVSVTFAATGGVPPYSWTVSGAIPSGTTFSSGGTLSGTANTTGTFQFTVAVTDATGTSVTKTFSLAVTAPTLVITTATIPAGQSGAAYTTQFAATGGVPPYTWTAGGLPAGFALSADGVLTGTPASSGTTSITITVADTAGTKTSQTFSLQIGPPAVLISTASLPNGAVGAAYSASLSATGGTPPYTWSTTGLPAGLNASAGGIVSGIPSTAGSFTVNVTVTDTNKGTANRIFTLAVAAPPLSITTTSLGTATVGAAYSLDLAAGGGVPPFTWSASGMPGGLSLSVDGILSGTPAAPGSPAIAFTVRDSAGTTAAKTLPLSIALPSSPTVGFNGLPDSTDPGNQSSLQMALGGQYPVDIAVTLTLTFTPDSGGDDPAVQFAAGGRTATVVVPAGTVASPNMGIQTGTVAGTVTITAHLVAASQDITPAPVPTRTIRINATAPVLTGGTAARASGGITVTVNGYASSRDLKQAIFTFTAGSGASLQTSQVTIDISALFAAWYQSAASAAFGSQFTFTQPFTVQGDPTQIVSVTVTLVSSVGSSPPLTLNLQ